MNNWQKDFNTNFVNTINKIEKKQLCCLNSITQIYTQNSNTIGFSGTGTQNDPLIANYIGEIIIGSGTVTSIGLSMPSAFSISNSPITTNGIINVTMNGNSNQYLRGDGTLATFPIIVNTFDQVLAQGGNLSASRNILLGAFSLNVLNNSSNSVLRLSPGNEFSLGDITGTSGGLLLKIDPTNNLIFLGNVLNQTKSIILNNTTDRIDLNSSLTVISNQLTVNGQIQIIGGSVGVGKVLTSDASGLATWQTPSSAYWTSATANNISNTNLAGVGIGITNPTAYLHLKGGTTVFPSLRFNSGSILAAPSDGAMEYDGVNLYFTIGTTRKIFPLGTTDTTIYTGDGSILSTRAIDVQNFSITWNNTGLFRIIKGDASVGGTYDFNSGVNFLSFDTNNSSNLVLDPVTGLTFEYVNVITPAILSSLHVNSTGIKLTGIQEFADNAAAITGGLSIGYVYRTGDTLKIVH